MLDEQDKFMLPWSPMTTEIKHDLRICVSMLQKEPHIWRITKINSTSPKGIVYLTVKQTPFDEYKDYVNLETGEMFADYYKTDIKPDDEEENIVQPEGYISLKCTVAQLKVGGSYRTITATCFDKLDMDVTTSYSDFIWEYTINGEDASALLDIKQIDINKIKIKFIGDEYYIEKNLVVKCISGTLNGELELDIVAL